MTTAERVYDYLQYHSDEFSTAKEIAEAIGTSRSTVSTALRKLEGTGAVKKIGEAFDGSKTWGLA